MPAHKGQPKVGGRVKGTPNKRTVELADRLAEMFPDYDPVMAMAALANDMTADPFMRFQASKEVAQYIHARRKSIDHTTGGDKFGTEVILPHVAE